MPNGVMLETSMFLHRDSANYLLALAKNGMLRDIYVSEKFIELAYSEPDKIARRLSQYLEIPGKDIDIDTLQRLSYEIYHAADIHKYGHHEYHTLYKSFYDRIKDEFIAKVMFEEWHFLNSQSWLFSKVRKFFDEMVELGGTAVHKSRKEFEQLVRHVLKKNSDEPLTPNDVVRAAAKWVAVGGPAVLGALWPGTETVSSVVSGYFLLHDP